jgi:hypothetical protein
MLYNLSVVCFVVKAYHSPEVLERSEPQMFLRTIHELGDSRCETFGQDEVLAAEVMLSDEETENF